MDRIARASADAMPGTLKLVPPAGRMPELEADYVAMRQMLFGEYTDLEEIVAYMRELEECINSGV